MSYRDVWYVMTTMIFVISCDNKSRLRVERYENGNIKSEVFYLSDSITHGKAQYYYVNGNLKGELNYSNGKKNGLARYYYFNGSLEGEVEYKDDSIHGEAKWYFINGKLESESFWIHGREYGSAYFYDNKGNLITYQCKDFLGDVIYLLKLSEDGYRVREQGAVFSYNFKTSPVDTSELRIGIPVIFEITVSEPPDYGTYIWVQNIDENGIVGKENHLIENSTILVTRSFNVPGRQGILVIGEIRNEKNELMRFDSVAFMVNVKP